LDFPLLSTTTAEAVLVMAWLACGKTITPDVTVECPDEFHCSGDMFSSGGGSGNAS